MLVPIDGARISDWESFHNVFRETLGFPDFYGRNMDAWIDCLTNIDDVESNLTGVHVSAGQFLTLAIDHVDDLANRCPEIYEALVECSAFVNWRRIERGFEPVLALSFYKSPGVKPGAA